MRKFKNPALREDIKFKNLNLKELLNTNLRNHTKAKPKS